MQKLGINTSRTKTLFLLIAAMGFVATGIWLVVHGNMFGWVAIMFFGSGIPIFIWQIVDSRPRLMIDDEGVTDRTLGVGRILWSDIQGAYVMSISGNDFICLDLKEPEKYWQKLSKVKRAMASANRKLGATEFNLNLSGVTASTEEIFELIMKHCELDSPETKIHQLEARLRQAMLESNIDELDYLLSDNLIFTDHLGAVWSKDDDLDAHASGAIEIENIVASEENIMLIERIAIVTVRLEISGIFGGAPAKGAFRFTRVWSPTSAGHWQVIAGHSTLIANAGSV